MGTYFVCINFPSSDKYSCRQLQLMHITRKQQALSTYALKWSRVYKNLEPRKV